VKGAKSTETGSDRGTLGISHLGICRAKIITGDGAILPLDFCGLRIERTDDVRDAVGIKHVERGNICGRAAAGVDYPTRFPTLHDPREKSVAVPEEAPVWSQW